MPLQRPPRPPSVLASVLAAAGLVLAVAGCGHITPLGPDAAATMPAPRHLGSPMIVQVMRSRPPDLAGGCPAGWVAVSMPPGAPGTPCYRPVGKPVTITSAAISPVSVLPAGPPGHPEKPAPYGFTVTVPAADAAAVTAVITQAFNSGDAFGVSAAGRLWEAARVLGMRPSPGRQFQIALLSRIRAFQLHRLLVPAG